MGIKAPTEESTHVRKEGRRREEVGKGGRNDKYGVIRKTAEGHVFVEKSPISEP